MKMHPWELANDAVMDSLKWSRTVPVRLERGQRDFDAFLIEQNFRFKQRKGHSIEFKLNQSQDASFVAASPIGNERRFFSNDSRNLWEDWFVTDCLRRREFSRQFFFFDGQLRQENTVATEKLLVCSDGKAAWSWHEQFDSKADALFPWNNPMSTEEFLFFPAPDVWATIQSLLADEQGEAAFARAFARKNEIERRETVVSWRGGSFVEMRDIVGCLLVAFGIYSDDGDEAFCFKSDRRLWDGWRRDSLPHSLPDEVQRNIERVWRYFEPCYLHLENFECVRSFVDDELNGCAIMVSPSSAHEKMEAMMRWRDWLEESGA